MRRAYKNFTLRSKIAIFTSLMVGASLLMLTFTTIKLDLAYSRRDLEEQAMILLDTLPYSTRDELYFVAVDELRDVAMKIGESESIKGFIIYDNRGAILANSNDEELVFSETPDELGSQLAKLEAGQAYTQWESDQLIAGEAVYLNERLIGAVSLVLSAEGVNRRINAIIIQSIAFSLVILLGSMGLSALLARQISNPVRELMKIAHNMASGNTDIRAEINYTDEIGELGLAFNEMTEAIQTREGALRELTASLEEKVQERTEELRQRNEELLQMARYDSLTKIYNRRYFFELATQEWERAKRYQHPLSLLILDADHFKNINDTHGHIVGDKVLENLALFLKSHIRSVDIVARYGGEEFILLMPEIDCPEANQTAERLRKRIAENSLVVDREIKITVSFGIACWQETENLSFEDFLHRADQALYQAKEDGRNRVNVWGA